MLRRNIKYSTLGYVRIHRILNSSFHHIFNNIFHRIFRERFILYRSKRYILPSLMRIERSPGLLMVVNRESLLQLTFQILTV